MNKMKDNSDTFSIFGFRLDMEWRGTLLFIAIVGVLYFSIFWTYIGHSIFYFYYLMMNNGPASIAAIYLGSAIRYLITSIFHLGAFCTSLYIFVRCKYSNLNEPELQEEPRLFKFRLSPSHLLGIFFVSLLVILFTVPTIIFVIIDFVQDFEWLFNYSGTMSGVQIFLSIFYTLSSLYLIFTKLGIIGICILSISVSLRTQKRNF